MKAQRAEAKAKRLTAVAAWRRQVQPQAEVRRLALEATKLAIIHQIALLKLATEYFLHSLQRRHDMIVTRASCFLGPISQ